METIKLKQNETGETVQVVENTTTNEVPYSADEIKRQIIQHTEVIERLEKQLQAVSAFEANSKITEDVVIPEIVEKSIINRVNFETATMIAVKKEIIKPIMKEELTEIKR